VQLQEWAAYYIQQGQYTEEQAREWVENCLLYPDPVDGAVPAEQGSEGVADSSYQPHQVYSITEAQAKCKPHSRIVIGAQALSIRKGLFCAWNFVGLDCGMPTAMRATKLF
jgi:hypothetical protein